MSKIDRIFTEVGKGGSPFVFDSNVAEVFDDMIVRSVPAYMRVQDLSKQLALDLCKKKGRILDLGCASATTLILLALEKELSDKVLIGVDDSDAMLEQAKERFSQLKLKNSIKLIKENIKDFKFEECDLVLSNYTLQFLSLECRKKVLNNIHQSLRPGGKLLLSEKIRFENKSLQKFIDKRHFKFKLENGYSQLEIAQKREALENVLVPLTENQNKQLILEAGFSEVETILLEPPFVSILGFY